ncbi:D-alanyl-D-alanine carboxypeptidase family protein [Bacillus spongiae]|uniref:D-alanyl-D-alanine carboxypeptidase family protein n=1 Tax=Bacillus spongiae TaxID=2683610 RepID=A0ABU8HEI9_9BACI
MKSVRGIVLSSLLLLSGCAVAFSKNVGESEQDSSLPVIAQDGEVVGIAEISATSVQELVDQFYQNLVQETDEYLVVKDFSSKEELVNHLSKYAQREFAEKQVNSLYEEESGQLRLIAQETKQPLQETEEVTLNKISDTEYVATQGNETDLLGVQTVEMVFVYENNKWLISDSKSYPDLADDYMSTLALINKRYFLPSDYVPVELVEPNVPFTFEENLPKKLMVQEAALALEELFSAAKKDGIDLLAVSGYRSYDDQTSIFAWNSNLHGEEEANQFSARPGHSEHQSGLAMDVSSKSVSYALIEEFGETMEGIWIAEHSADYGFIIRYPEGKEEITGYTYEPWHLRFVGKEAAKEIWREEITLEEYLGEM